MPYTRFVIAFWIMIYVSHIVNFAILYLEKSNFYKFNSKRRIISLLHSSILRRIWLNFMALYLDLSALSQFFFGFPTFRPEHH
jgi:hypothetical protein